MITAAGSEPGSGGVSPGAAIRAGSADRGGRGQSQHLRHGHDDEHADKHALSDL